VTVAQEEEMSVAFKRFLIMCAGVGTTIATLVLAATTSAVDLLYIYHRFVVLLPTGAFTLGVLAGSGYGVAGWFLTRLRFTVAMLRAIAASMFITYCALAIIEYEQNAPRRMGFFEYFDRATQQATMSEPTSDLAELLENPEDAPEPLGVDGYGYRFVELLGLTIGGMGGLFIVPGIRKRLALD
jgi:hypothetical protein